MKTRKVWLSEPPAAEVEPSPPKEKAQTAPTVAQKVRTTLDALLGFTILAVVFGLPTYIVWGLLPDRWTNAMKYGLIYHVGADHVYSDSKPKDCDWGHAPIGDKACHYTKQVIPVRDDSGHVTTVYVTWEKVPE